LGAGARPVHPILGVVLAPLSEGATTSVPAFPDREIIWEDDPQDLKIAVTAPECEVVASRTPLIVESPTSAYLHHADRLPDDLTGEAHSNSAIAELRTYPIGTSSVAAFFLRPRKPMELKARILAVHGNRILQTVILQGRVLPAREDTHPGGGTPHAVREEPPSPPIRLIPEGTIRSSVQDADRRKFDLAILTNDSLTGCPQCTAIWGGSVTLRDFKELKDASERIGKSLRQLVDNPEPFDQPDFDATTTLLRILAHEGVLLRDAFDDHGLRPVIR